MLNWQAVSIILIITVVILSLIIYYKSNHIGELLKKQASEEKEYRKDLANYLTELHELRNFKITYDIDLKKAQQTKDEAEQKIKEYDHYKNALTERYNHAMANLECEIEKQSSQKATALVNEKLTELDSHINKMKMHRELVTPFNKLCDLDSYNKSILNGRLNNAFNAELLIKEINISAEIQSAENEYHVTLTGCTCKDFQCRKEPCKHMLYLAYLLGLLQIDQKQSMAATKLISTLKYLRDNETQIQINKERIKELRSKATNLQSFINELDQIIKEKQAAYPRIAGLIADHETLHYATTATLLLHKKNPAPKAADEVKKARAEIREIKKEKKIAEYKLAYIEKLFPNINDIFDEGFDEQTDFKLETEESTDRVRLFLTPEEYSKLSTAEKNQLALDRYLEGRKSKWQIGRDYEMYIGNKLEELGYHVEYTGIIENLEDMGRDLIATKEKETYIMQCKNWSQEKTIHEKHIFQLYGTVVLWKLENPFFDVKGVFVTTTKLSEKAKAVANELDIEIRENIPLSEFPRIKCNINRANGEKIYHLPFDQQYDKAVIEKEKGECYAFTVEEAETLGFRRAGKYFN